jgi:hypothetical protein
MKCFSKFAAGLLAVLLIAVPLVAATPCIGIAHSTPDCTQCCDQMSASMGMTTAAAMMGNMQDQLSQVTCCKARSSEDANLAINQEPQGSVSPVADRADIAIASPSLAPAPPQRVQTLPDRYKSDRVYSDLCTFRI